MSIPPAGMRASTSRGLVAGCLCFSILGCASAPPQRLGIGDIAFRLEWSGSSDLDLYVRSPLGEEISVGHRTSASGGLLDRDCNATPETMCGQPIENVYWPSGRAPRGTYQYWVRFVILHEAVSPIVFQVRVLKGSRVIAVQGGSVIGYPRPSETLGVWEVLLGK